MNILFVNHHASAHKYGNGYRTYYIAKELSRQGHNTYVLASSFSSVRQSQPVVKGSALTVENLDGVNFIWLNCPAYNKKISSRLWNIFVFLLEYYKNKKEIAELVKPDVVCEATTYMLPFFITKWLARKTKSLLVFEIRDLWPLSIIEIGGYSNLNPLIIFLSYCQRKAVTSSDLVVSNLKFASAYFRSRSIEPKRYLHLPNGVDLYEPTLERGVISGCHSQVSRLKEQYDYIVGYTGALGRANSVDYLVEAAANLMDRKIAFVIIGQGERKKGLETFCNQEALDNVYFFDSIPKGEVLEVIKLFDIGFVGGRSRKIHMFGVSPNKLYDYMLQSVPVLFALDSPDDVVSANYCGVRPEEFNPRGISHAILKFIDLPLSTQRKMGANGRNYVLNNHDYKDIANKLVESF